MRLEYLTFLLLGLVLGLTAYAATFAFWALSMWLANHPEALPWS